MNKKKLISDSLMVVNDNDDDDDVNDIDSDFLLIFHSLLRNMSGGVESLLLVVWRS